MSGCGIDWNVLGTWVLVLATWALVAVSWIAAWRTLKDQRAAAAEQQKLGRDAIAQQQETARIQLAVRAHLDMEERFDRGAMLRERAYLARQLIRGAPPEAIIEAVPDFFESLGILDRLGYLLPDLTYNSFSVYVIYWWAALKDWIRGEREADEDPTLYEEFEQFAIKLMDEEARHRGTTREVIEPTSADDMREFLDGEAQRGEVSPTAQRG